MQSAGAGGACGTVDEPAATADDELIAAYYSAALHIHVCTLQHSN